MINKFILFFGLILLSACSTGPLHHYSDQSTQKFLFADSLPKNTFISLHDYRTHRKLENGVEYGSFIRSFKLKGESATSLKKKLASSPCSLKEDVIREPKNNTPIHDQNGKTTPIWIWLCQDGGVIRAKPLGDPTSKYRKQAEVSKSLRYPPTGEFHGFNDETVKLDDEGNALPKWPADLKSKDPAVMNEWGDRVHIDLVNP